MDGSGVHCIVHETVGLVVEPEGASGRAGAKKKTEIDSTDKPMRSFMNTPIGW
jgi:hypothetical protein